jgi:dihydroorotate dehydrogenase
VVSGLERVGLALLHRIDPERAHGLSLLALRSGLAPLPGPVDLPRLRTTLAGLPLLNPVGLAAGYDKNAEAVAPLCRAGFGFIEVGAATPLPQPGNDRPRLFRLTEDRAAINRFGFNNQGMEAIGTRLAARTRGPVPVGLNLGANKTAQDRAADFATVLAHCGPHVDFATVNVSSPNTERLRDLQGRAALAELLRRVMEARAGLARPIPVFLKIAPDLADDDLQDIVDVALAARISGIIATNTTISREGLKSASRGEAGRTFRDPIVRKVHTRSCQAFPADPRPPAADRGRRGLLRRGRIPEDPRRSLGGAALHGDGLPGDLDRAADRPGPRRPSRPRRLCQRLAGRRHRPRRLALGFHGNRSGQNALNVIVVSVRWMPGMSNSFDDR